MFLWIFYFEGFIRWYKVISLLVFNDDVTFSFYMYILLYVCMCYSVEVFDWCPARFTWWNFVCTYAAWYISQARVRYALLVVSWGLLVWWRNLRNSFTKMTSLLLISVTQISLVLKAKTWCNLVLSMFLHGQAIGDSFPPKDTKIETVRWMKDNYNS